MAEGGPPGPVPPQIPPPALQQLQQPQQPPQPVQQVLPPQPGHPMGMNWSHFKPEFSGKPEEDVEAHLLRTNDWMTTHDFPEGVKVRRFCLTLTGEARLWYASLEPIALTWQELQGQFRRQYSKLGNTREQLFHAWRSFHYDENVETPDVYVTRIRQVAELLGYGEPQVLEVFKNTVPNRLYWVLFPIDNLREAVDTAKRFLTKEKIDKQMSGQSQTPFMKLTEKKDKTVSFDNRDVLEKSNNKIDKMTALMDKMCLKLEERAMPYRPQVYQRRGRGRRGRGYNSSNWRGNRSFSRTRGYRGYDRNRSPYRGGTFGRGRFRGRENANTNNGSRYREDRRPRRQSRPRERQETRSPSSSRSRSSSRTTTNRDRVRCFRCREYDHYARECPNSPSDASEGESNGAAESLQMLADSDVGSDVEHCLNI